MSVGGSVRTATTTNSLQAGVAMRNRVTIDLRVWVRRSIPKHDRDFMQPDALRGPPPPGAEVNLMPSLGVSRMDDDGLQDAVLADVLREIVDFGVGDLGARVVGVCVEAGRRHHRGQACSGEGRDWRYWIGFKRFGRSGSIQQIQLQVVRFAPGHAHARHRAGFAGRTVVPPLIGPPRPTPSMGVPLCPAKSQEQRRG